jgi:hypothetical protein
LGGSAYRGRDDAHRGERGHRAHEGDPLSGSGCQQRCQEKCLVSELGEEDEGESRDGAGEDGGVDGALWRRRWREVGGGREKERGREVERRL